MSIWLVSTLFLRGDLGKWNDDYFFLGQFDAATGEVRSYTLDRTLHFWRPVYRLVATPLITALFEHDRILHVISAVVHGLTCLFLYGLMRRMHLSRVAAGLAAMLMLVWPSHYEVVFWNTCNFTAIATAGCLACTWAYMNWLERRRPVDGALLPVWTSPVVMGGLGFLVAATNEQPAAAVGALPLLGIAFVLAPVNAGAIGSIRRSGGRWRALIRAAAPMVCAAIGVGAYLAVQTRRHPPQVGRNIGAMVATEELPRRTAELAGEVWSHLWLNNFRTDAFHFGRAAMGGESALAVLAFVVIALGAVLWVRTSTPGTDLPERPSPPRWRAALIVFGVGWFMVCWLPIARIVYPASPRLFYAPLAGLAIAVGAALDLMIGSPRHAPRARAIVSTLTIVVMVFATVVMIGIQRAYQARWHADLAQARELVELVPNPPSRAIFVPIRVVDKLAGAERSSFSRRFYPPLHSSWAGGWWLQMAYKRSDVFAAQAIGPWDRVPLEAVASTSSRDGAAPLRALPRNPMMPPFRRKARSGSTFPWDRVIPFEIDDEGRVRVFSGVAVEWADGRRESLALEALARAPGARGQSHELEVRQTNR